jgi:RNA polymerase sigma factor (sigma-70 family)
MVRARPDSSRRPSARLCLSLLLWSTGRTSPGAEAWTTASSSTRHGTVRSARASSSVVESPDVPQQSVSSIPTALPSLSTIRRRRRQTPSSYKPYASSYQGSLSDRLLMDHEILTRDEELALGNAVQRAQAVRRGIEQLGLTTASALSPDAALRDDPYLPYNDYESYAADAAVPTAANVPSPLERQAQRSLLPNEGRVDRDDRDNILTELVRLSDDDIRLHLGIAGGRAQVRSILLDGALARDTLIASNVRLVVSIAKKWAKNAHKAARESMQSIYSGGWNRPSLDEAVQEGILGLAKAADRYDPERGLRFATYATYWVTNSVRFCFQTASTGCLRVPVGFHDTKTKFKRLVKEYYDEFGDAPGIDDLAEQMGLTRPRLEVILRSTRPLVSIDAPLRTGAVTQAGKAGNDVSQTNLLLADLLTDEQALPPEDLVELSFLRQNLENAMATELAPHERDVLRLRLGLDDGVTRTARQVAEECGNALTVAEVRSTERRAFQKLRSPQALANYQLLAYLDFAGVDRDTLRVR